MQNVTRLLLCLLLGAAVHAEDAATPWGEIKRRSIQKAQESDERLKLRFEHLLESVEEHHPSGDADHTRLLGETLQQAHRDWLLFRASHCESEALLYAYPGGSSLYVQEYHACLNALNTARIDYFDDLLKAYAP